MILHYGWPRSMDGKEEILIGIINGIIIRKNMIYDVAPENITIHAALFTVNGVLVMKHDVPDEYNWWGQYIQRNITLWGNITQWERKL